MNNYIYLLKTFSKKPGMFIVKEDFESVCSFISGFDCAINGTLLNGFNEWLIYKLKRESSLYWGNQILVHYHLLGKKLSNEENQKVIDHLFTYLFEFLELKGSAPNATKLSNICIESTLE